MNKQTKQQERKSKKKLNEQDSRNASHIQKKLPYSRMKYQMEKKT